MRQTTATSQPVLLPDRRLGHASRVSNAPHAPVPLEPSRQSPPRRLLPADFFAVFVHAPRALRLAFESAPRLLAVLVVCALAAGVLPGAIAWVGQGLVDAVLQAVAGGSREVVLHWVLLEGGLVLALLLAQRTQQLTQSLLRARLGHKVHTLLFDKALQLSLAQFEDSATYDLLTRARREASTRPLGLLMKLLAILQQVVTLGGLGALLWTLSPWAVVALVLAGLPAFVAEARFSGEAFRLFRYRSPETRLQLYLETLMAREDAAKEVQIYGLGPRLLARYQQIHDQIYAEDKALTWRRHWWGLGLSVVATLVQYGAYALLAVQAAAGRLTLGAMTAGLLAFRQGQQAFGLLLQSVGGLYEDNLYVSTLFELLDVPVQPATGTATSGPDPTAGLQFEAVSFVYPGATEPALREVSLSVKPGQTLALVGHNGSGKTTLIKLLSRLYQPTSGRIVLDGMDLQDWQPEALRQRIGVIFQDFLRYQFQAGENIGAGDVRHYDDPDRWQQAAVAAEADSLLQSLPQGYHTQLGKWFGQGRELSGGQWQRVALARALMRKDAQILVLDEPTAAMDAEAELAIFDRLQEAAAGRMCILISHRFSTVRRADHICMLEGGAVVEAGSHEALVRSGGRYAQLFEAQAQGYR